VSEIFLDKILKDCFWEYDFTKEDILDMAKSQDLSKKKFLFEKILANSTSLLKSMQIFDKNTLEDLIESYKVPKFNQEYLLRRINMLEFFFLEKPLKINELKWVA